MKRWTGGTTDLEETLADSVDATHFNAGVEKVWSEGDKVHVMDSSKKIQTFDYGIMALQANHSGGNLGSAANE